MKAKILLLSGVMALLPLVAIAHEGETGDDSHQTQAAQAESSHKNRDAARQLLEKKRHEFEAKKAELQAKAKSKRDEACQKRLDHLGSRVTNSDTHKKGLLEHYTKAAAHIQKVIDRATAKGVDTTQLRADLVAYNTKVATLEADYDTFTSAVVAAQSLDCEQARDALKTAHTQIQAAHQKVVTDRKAIHNFVKTTLWPDMVKVIKALGEKKSSDAATEKQGE